MPPRVARVSSGLTGRGGAGGHLWHPFADMSKVPGNEIVLERGTGAWVVDSEGRRYLDATAGLWYCNVGHGRAEIADAAAQQMRELAGYQIFDAFSNRPALELADRLYELLPLEGESAVFFTTGGSDAIDTAGKIARRFWAVSGESQRHIIVAREGAYHGMNAYGTSLAGIPANAGGWGPLVPEVVHVDRDDVSALEDILQRDGGQVAAFIGELVQGAGGVHPPRPGYWEEVQALCREHGVLLIVDEVVTGFGRLGSWLGCEQYGISPDLVVTAKGLSSGYAPIGAVVVSERVRDVLWAPDAGRFRHGYTYSGHPAACAASLANLKILEEEHLLMRVHELTSSISSALEALASHPMVEEVRVAGLLAGVEISADVRHARPTIVDEVVAGTRSRGVLVRNLLGETLQISPPFVITSAELELIGSALMESLDELADRPPESAMLSPGGA